MKGKKALALAILPFFGALAADNASHVSYGSDNDSRQNRVAVRPAPGTDHQMNNDFEQKNTYGVSMYGDYLYLKPYVSQLPWAQSTQGHTSTAAIGWADYSSLDQINFAFNGDSAFRIGAAYESEWNTIGFAVDWMSFHSSQTNRRQATAQNANTPNGGAAVAVAADRLFPFWADNFTVEGNSPGSVYSAKATMQMNFDFVDYRVTSVVHPASFVQMTPNLGIRTLYTTNNLKTEFIYNTWAGGLVADGLRNTLTTKSKQDYNAIGPILGSRALFEIVDGFRFVTDASFSYVVGQNKSSILEYFLQNSFPRQEFVKDDQSYFKTLYDLQVGLQYEWMTDERDFGLMFEVAYEAHYFPNFISYIDHNYGLGGTGSNQRGTSLNPTIANFVSDFAMQGLHVRGGMSF